MEKISILIPVYNTAELLSKCLDSVLEQTYPAFEVVAVNDGSTDDSLAVLERYAALDGRLKVVSQPNGGHQNARKVGMDHSMGSLIAFVDSDDSLPSSTVLERMAAAMIGEVQIVAGRVNIDDGKRLRMFPSAVFDELPMKDYLCRYLLCGRAGWNICGKLFRREAALAVLPQPIKVTSCEDALYTISIASNLSGRAVMVNIPVYNYYIREGSITRTRRMQSALDNFAVADCIDGLLKSSVELKYLVAFRLLCMSGSFRYGWLGRRHPMIADTIELYRRTRGVLPLLTLRKRLIVWMLIHFGDAIDKYVFRNHGKED